MASIDLKIDVSGKSLVWKLLKCRLNRLSKRFFFAEPYNHFNPNKGHHMSARKPKLDLDQSLEKLEDLVLELEGGGLTLEGSLKTFEDGIKLTRDCQKMLDKAEQKVRILLEEDSPSQTQSDQQ